jgi:hypothetical protein
MFMTCSQCCKLTSKWSLSSCNPTYVVPSIFTKTVYGCMRMHMDRKILNKISAVCVCFCQPSPLLVRYICMYHESSLVSYKVARWYICIPKIPIQAYFEGPWNGVGIFYDHLDYFTAPRVYFVAIWYIFPHFGMLYREKSGNPGLLPMFFQ